MMMIIEGHIEMRDPLREGDIQIKVGDLLIEEAILMEDLLEEDIPIGMGRPPGRGGYPGGPPDGDGGLLVMEDPLDLLVDKDHQALKDPLDQ